MTPNIKIDFAFGVLDYANLGTLAFDASSTAALAANSTYTLIATEDCYIHFTDGAEAATSSSMFLPANQYVSFRTNAVVINIYAIKRSIAGTLHYCKMTV